MVKRGCREFIKNLPREDAPEVFGLHASAGRARELEQSRRFIEQLTSIQLKGTISQHVWSNQDLTLAGRVSAGFAFAGRMPEVKCC